MISGKGVLVTKGGGRLRVTYEYVRTVRRGFAGQLVCAEGELDPGLFAHAMQLECEDGAILDVALTLSSGGHIGFVGRQAERAGPARL